jgi:hypothetical protein
MRVVYGASAVAAMGVIAVGLVQPGSSPATTSDSNQAAVTQPTDGGQQQNQAQQPADVQVRHVIKYIHLKPGQTAPPGATVITPDAPAPRVVVTHAAPPPPANNPAPPPAHNPAPPPAHNPAPPPVVHNPPPPPPPVVHTRPSGRP